MLIKYKYIEHERTEDAPFVGALIVADGCKFKCKRCFNRDLKKMESIKAEAEVIIYEILANPFNEGIILGGLEWSEQPEEMLELASLAQKYDLQVCIYTGCELGEFHERVGRKCAKKVGYEEYMKSPLKDEDDSELYRFLGATIMDFYLPNDYYVKTGRYDETKLTEENRPFEVKLSTSNQKMYLMKKAEDGKDGIKDKISK